MKKPRDAGHKLWPNWEPPSRDHFCHRLWQKFHGAITASFSTKFPPPQAKSTELIAAGLVEAHGKGRGAHYVRASKCPKKAFTCFVNAKL